MNNRYLYALVGCPYYGTYYISTYDILGTKNINLCFFLIITKNYKIEFYFTWYDNLQMNKDFSIIYVTLLYEQTQIPFLEPF